MTLRLGDVGDQVRDWQRALIARGYALIADGVFGKRTHNATLAFQVAHGLPTTGRVELNELQVIAAPDPSSMMPPTQLAHSIPFIESRHYLRPKPGKSVVRAAVDLIVLHCIECPEASTRAESTALWMASDKAPMASAHYFVDADSVVQGVPDHCVAFHAPGVNHSGIGIEHAGYARQTREEWLDEYGQRMLELSAQLSARLCQRWRIPATYVPAADLRAHKRGITTHREVSTAFGRSDHYDPGPNFPIAWYIDRVRFALEGRPV